MVNTFLTSLDYEESARYLDSRRLGKQRVEAYQILLSIQKLKYLSKLMKIKVPIDPYMLYDWVRSVISKYKKSNYKVYELEHKYNTTGEGKLIKFGFCYHPAVLLWINYEDSLKSYINAHIKEWIRRGYENNMTIYKVSLQHASPRIFDTDFIFIHQAKLVSKEITKNENPWYIKNKLFMKSYHKYAKNGIVEYIWPYTP